MLLTSVIASSGNINWSVTYRASSSNNISTIDGDISPDGLKYYFLVDDTSNLVPGILNVKVSDGSFIRYVKYSYGGLYPAGLAVSSLDKIGMNS